MKQRNRFCCLLLVLFGALWGGCADAPLTHIHGTITSNGEPVEGSRVVAMNRITDEKYTTSADADGKYSVTLPPGYYDVGADKGARYAVIRALVDTRAGPVALDLEVPAAEADHEVFGTVRIRGGEPAAHYHIKLSSNVNDVAVETTTDENGAFAASVEGEANFDIDIADSDGEFIEHVDVQKLSGPLQLDIHLGDEEDNNVQRHDEAGLQLLQVASDPCADSRPMVYSQTEVYYSVCPDTAWTCWDQSFFLKGAIPLDCSADISPEQKENAKEMFGNIETLRVDAHGSFWFEYAAYIKTDKAGSFYFIDGTGQEMLLEISRTDREHKVSFGSGNPTIVTVQRKKQGSSGYREF